MTDLTAITTPFGLLDEVYGPGTQEALKAHGGPWEYYDDGAKWEDCQIPMWVDRTTYRVKPAPPKPREWWATNQILHPTLEKATKFRDELIAENPGCDFSAIIHVREVLPE
jgi:hypothetical protein